MSTYDVIIIGAGPAGAMAAKTISEHGFSVLLIDRKKEIGEPVQCGEAITKYSLEHMNIPIQQTWIRQEVKGVKILLPNQKSFYSTVPGLSIDRKSFDQYLIDQALNKGAKLQKETMMKDIKRVQKKWIVKTNQNTDIKAQFVIGADGPESKTAQKLGLIKSKLYIKAFQYTFSKKEIDFPINDWLCMHMDEKYHGGFGWIFPRKDEYNVGVGSIQSTISDLEQLCMDFSFDSQKKKRITAGLVPFKFDLSARTSHNAVIIGDAAGLTNPVTGGGIHAALYSGDLAGRIINESIEKKDNIIINKYDTIISNSMFLHPIHHKTATYFQQWTNKDWQFLGDSVNGLDMADLSLTQCFKIGMKHPKYFLRSKELLTIRKAMKINQKYGW